MGRILIMVSIFLADIKLIPILSFVSVLTSCAFKEFFYFM